LNAYFTSVKINFYTYKAYSDRLYKSLRKKVEIHTVSRFSKNSLSSNIINETIKPNTMHCFKEFFSCLTRLII